MKRLITALGLLVMTSTACKAVVLDPVGNDPGAGGGGTGTAKNAIAMRAADWTVTSTGLGSFSPQSQQGFDPEALVIFISGSPQECGAPLIQSSFDTVKCGMEPAFWQAIFILPPELHHPGLIDLRDRRLMVHRIAWDPCMGGGFGSTPGVEGTLEIVATDAGAISVKLRDVPNLAWGDIDGDYTAAFCGQAPQQAPPEQGRAISGADLTTLPDGGAPDPDALYLFLGSGGESCDDPFGSIECTGTSRVMLKLPPALQTPGIIDLDDPAIDASYVVSRDAPTSCASGELVQGIFEEGTVEIVNIDAGGVTARLYGTHSVSEGGSFDGDGLFLASPCP